MVGEVADVNDMEDLEVDDENDVGAGAEHVEGEAEALALTVVIAGALPASEIPVGKREIDVGGRADERSTAIS